MKGRKMSFQRIFLPVIFLPGFQSDRSEAFFNLIVQVEIFCDFCAFSWLDQGKVLPVGLQELTCSACPQVTVHQLIADLNDMLGKNGEHRSTVGSPIRSF